MEEIVIYGYELLGLFFLFLTYGGVFYLIYRISGLA